QVPIHLLYRIPFKTSILKIGAGPVFGFKLSQATTVDLGSETFRGTAFPIGKNGTTSTTAGVSFVAGLEFTRLFVAAFHDHNLPEVYHKSSPSGESWRMNAI